MLDRVCQKMIKFQCYKFYRFSIKKKFDRFSTVGNRSSITRYIDQYIDYIKNIR